MITFVIEFLRELKFNFRDAMFKLSARSRVAIVGAGPGGLCAAARLKQFGVQKTTLFESASTLGGTWRYSESAESDASSSMYANLRTNLPKVPIFHDL